MILPHFLSLLLCGWPQGPTGSWCTVSAAGGDVPANTIAAVQAEVAPALGQLREVFPDLPHAAFRVVVHRGRDDLPAELIGAHHEGSPGFALLGRHEIHLLLRETATAGKGLRAVLVHEFTHELLDQACEPWGGRVPRWFHEGLAQLIAGDTYLGASEEMIVWRAATQQLLPFSELAERFPADPHALTLAYAQSYSYVAWLEQQIGRRALVAMARSVNQEKSFELALVHATDLSTAVLTDAWCDHLVHASGARWRILLQQFFSLTMVLALPLLALAMIRRMRTDRAMRERLERAEAAEPPESPEPWSDEAANDEAVSDEPVAEGDGDDPDVDPAERCPPAVEHPQPTQPEEGPPAPAPDAGGGDATRDRPRA